MTKPRYGNPYKWPLNKFIPLKKQWEVTGLLSSLGWTKKTLDEVSFHLALIGKLVFCNNLDYAFVW